MTELAKSGQRPTLYEVELPVTIVVGRTTLSLNDLADWKPDSVVSLDAKSDQPLELCVNGKVVATGELCEGDQGPDSLAIRILDIKQDAETA
ncbi:FliM/FliN family flagellar motor C-terminal domain-containing protein [Parvularcula sp. LCG005]|uniref:FliM/FliN family flagellar motor C-terminal domain-containing protein n=1 Tax=Parvularcula sp. LCG005 TaxID=3078805 RepID=UPI0029433977|nr:FliM/FliN family flagellar motor C-terminal domain-containing protein [Parvularcula sp. LCG005]WOI52698.1 FliM/FliN family flagellar motor C-terminal domain-containing protein [Parvularcula sp. LCG005]